MPNAGPRPCAAATIATPLRAEIARALGRGHQDRRRTVVLGAAVVQVERLDDPARGVVGSARERLAVPDRARVPLRVGVGRERDLGERLLRDAVIVHEALRVERALLCRRQEPVEMLVGEVAAGAARRARLAEAAELPLRERAERDHVPRVARRRPRHRRAARPRPCCSRHRPRAARSTRANARRARPRAGAGRCARPCTRRSRRSRAGRARRPRRRCGSPSARAGTPRAATSPRS